MILVVGYIQLLLKWVRNQLPRIMSDCATKTPQTMSSNSTWKQLLRNWNFQRLTIFPVDKCSSSRDEWKTSRCLWTDECKWQFPMTMVEKMPSCKNLLKDMWVPHTLSLSLSLPNTKTMTMGDRMPPCKNLLKDMWILSAIQLRIIAIDSFHLRLFWSLNPTTSLQ